MCPYRVTVILIVTALFYVCGTSAGGTKHSVLHISPAVVKGSNLHKLRSRDEIPEAPQDGAESFRLATVNKLAELVVKRSSGEDAECRNTIVKHPTNNTAVAAKTGDQSGDVGKVNKKKTVIGSDPLEEPSVVHADTATPDKRVISSLLGSRPMKKTIDPKTSLSGLIAAMKNKALSSFLGSLNSNTKTALTAARKSSTSIPSEPSSKSKLESFLAGASEVTSTQLKTDNTQQKSPISVADKPVPDSKVADAGKSILAAIDDKEGLRAALAKAIDRVEKVVANKNGALAIANKKVEDAKKEETKTAGEARSPDGSSSNRTVNSNSTEAKNVTVESSPLTVASNSSNSTATNATTIAPPAPVVPVVKDPYAEIAMGPDKPKIPELKGEEESASAQPGVMKLGAEGNPAELAGAGGAGAGAVGGAGAGGGGEVDGKPLAGMHDVGGLLDSLTDKVNLADTKGIGTTPGVPGDPVSTMLDRAQDKFNGMGGDLGADGASNEVKYMQSQLSEGNDEPSASKLMEKVPSGDAIKPLMQQKQLMGADDLMSNKVLGSDDAAMKALAGGNDEAAMKALVGGGEEMPTGRAGGTNSGAIKPMEKEDVFNTMLKNQGTDGDDDATMKGMGSMKEDNQMKDDGDGGDDMSPHDMRKTDDDSAPMSHKDPESSESLVKDILDKAGSMSPKGSSDDGFKEFQGADISPGPDPYENDKNGPGESYGSMYGGGGGGGGGGGRMKQTKFSDDQDSYQDMPNGHDMNGGVQNFSPHSNPDESFGDNYDKGSDFDGPGPPRESIESNDEQQMPGRPGGGSRGLESYLNMANINPLGTDNTFQTRQVIPEHAWRNPRAPSAGGAASDSFHENYNAQIFKKNVILRPEKDSYVSPFKDKASYDVDQ